MKRYVGCALLLIATLAAGAPDAGNLLVPAEVLALRDVRVPAEVNGRVVARPDDETKAVKRGEVLVQLDDVLHRMIAEGALAAADRAKAGAEWAAIELKREANLADKGSNRPADLERARIVQREAAASLVVAEAAAAQAQERLARTRIRAPFDGRLVLIPAETGEYLRVGETAFRIVDDSSLRIVAYVEGRHLARLRVGQEVTVRADVSDDAPVHKARLHSIAPAAEGAARTFRVEARLRNPRGLLRPGMTARLNFGPAKEK